MGGAGWKDVQNAAAKRELTVFVGGILATETGIDQQLGQVAWRECPVPDAGSSTR